MAADPWSLVQASNAEIPHGFIDARRTPRRVAMQQMGRAPQPPPRVIKETNMPLRSLVLLLTLAQLTLIPQIAAAQAGRLVLPEWPQLAKKASKSVDLSLDPSMLSLAGGFLNADPNPRNAAVQDLLNGLQGIYVRSYQFDQDGAYSKADLDSVRAQLVAPEWKPLVSTHDRKQESDVDIFVRRNGDRTEGMAIISSQPRELTIVNIVGSVDLAKLGQLQGQFGIPKIDVPSSGDSSVPASSPGVPPVPR
jgi:hypothetical protein